MMNSIQGLLLGVVQGLAEFLPISSSAHLVLVPRFLRWQDPGLAFDVALHLGTLLAVVLYFWKDLARLAEGILKPGDPALSPQRRLIGYLAIATFPGAAAGLLLEHAAENAFRSPVLIAGALIGMGVLLLWADSTTRGEKTLTDLTWVTALVLGVAQGLALIPGVSRAGVTITVGLFLGLRRPEAARFSFLMSVPIIAGAGILKFKEIFLSPDQAAVMAGFAGAAISGFIAIWFLMRYVQRHRYLPFVLYRWALGLFVLTHLSRFQ